MYSIHQHMYQFFLWKNYFFKTLTLLIYAFCNIDDLSWGTKGATENSGGMDKKMRYYLAKVDDFLSKFLASNLLMIGALIILESFLKDFLGEG